MTGRRQVPAGTVLPVPVDVRGDLERLADALKCFGIAPGAFMPATRTLAELEALRATIGAAYHELGNALEVVRGTRRAISGDYLTLERTAIAAAPAPVDPADISALLPTRP